MLQEQYNVNNGLNEGYASWRMSICLECPLYSPKFDGICNSRLWLNPDTGDVKSVPKEGYIRGCNCRLKNKTSNKDSSCPAGKW